MAARERGTILLEFLLAAGSLLALAAGFLWLVERIFIVHQLEYHAARAALQALENRRGQSKQPIRCGQIREIRAANAVRVQANCGKSARSVLLQR